MYSNEFKFNTYNNENDIDSNNTNTNNEEISYSQMVEYFHPRSHEEDMPINFSAALNQKYFYLESIFNTYYNAMSLVIAKNSSLEEQHQRNLNDNSSFIYGEIVIIIIYIYISYLYIDISFSCLYH